MQHKGKIVEAEVTGVVRGFLGKPKEFDVKVDGEIIRIKTRKLLKKIKINENR